MGGENCAASPGLTGPASRRPRDLWSCWRRAFSDAHPSWLFESPQNRHCCESTWYVVISRVFRLTSMRLQGWLEMITETPECSVASRTALTVVFTS